MIDNIQIFFILKIIIENKFASHDSDPNISTNYYYRDEGKRRRNLTAIFRHVVIIKAVANTVESRWRRSGPRRLQSARSAHFRVHQTD